MILNSFLKDLKNSSFLRRVKTLSKGTLIAQLITLISAPILTRIYHPENFAVLSLFLAITSILSPIFSGRYEVAIFLAKKRDDQKSLFSLAIWIAISLSLLILSIQLICGEKLLLILKLNLIKEYWNLIPIATFLLSVNYSLRYFINKYNNDFRLISKSIITQSTTYAAVSILLGYLIDFINGMIIAIPISHLISIIILYKGSSSKSYLRRILIPNNEIIDLAIKFRQFPLFNASTTLLDNATVALPIFFLAKSYSILIVGYYELVNRAANLPFNFLSQSISQVNINKISDINENNGDATIYIKKITFYLIVFIVIPSLLISIFAPDIFSLVFGKEWRTGGEFLQILMPAFAWRFVVSSLSSSISASGHNKLSSVWKIIAFISTFLCFSLFSGRIEIKSLLYIITVLDIFLYSLYYCAILYSTKNPRFKLNHS